MTKVIDRQQQLSLFAGTTEAVSFHDTTRHGFFSVNWRNAETRAQAEHVQLLLNDIKAYETGAKGLATALRSDPSVSTVEERLAKLRAEVQGHSPVAVRQRCYELSKLPVVLDMLTKSACFSKTDYWISQHGFSKPNRRATCVQSLNLLFADLDIRAMDHWLKDLSPESAAEQTVRIIEDAGLPLPSFVIWSGNGLHVKWLLDDAVPRSAKPVWDAMQMHLVKKLKDAGLPVDEKARDVSRILRVAGTYNQKGGELVKIVWINGSDLDECLRHDFNYLADGKQIMPWSRPEARELKAIGKIWDANKAIQKSIAELCKPNVSIQQFIAKDMWHARLCAIRRLVEKRYGGSGVPKGERNQYVWLAANALAWSASAADDYFRDLQPVIREIAPTMTTTEIMSSASTINRRIHEVAGKDTGLYMMTGQKFNRLLEITDEEASWIFSESGVDRSEWNVGIMGFEKMKNLPYQDYVAETKRRQAEAGRRSSEVRKSTKPIELHQKARELASQGLSIRKIAAALEVSVGTAHNWLKAS